MEETPAAVPVSRDSLESGEEAALVIMEDICRASGLDLRPEPRLRHQPYLEVELIGEDAERTLGHHGHSLDALQYLANLVISRRNGPDVRVILDAGGYRARREAVLTRLARDFAAEVKARQQECELDPLPAHERRIIHRALLDDAEVRTYSEGNDPDRRVIIAPNR